MVARDGVGSQVPHPTVGAIVVAAGESRRMRAVDKTFAPLMGEPLVAHSLRAFEDSPDVDVVVLVLSARNIELGRHLIDERGWRKVVDVCVGGARRQDSVRIGLERLGDVEWVVVHDGARPFVDEAMITRGLAEANETGAAIAAVPVADTIKTAGGDGLVSGTIPREGLWAAQTPQVFRRELLAEAHRLVAEEVTDDAAMVERVGGKVRLFMGSADNVKVTMPEDLTVAEGIMHARRGGAAARRR